jgi:hypothetical protein
VTAPVFGWWGPYHWHGSAERREWYGAQFDWRFGVRFGGNPRYTWSVALDIGPFCITVERTRWWDGIQGADRSADYCPRDRTRMTETRVTSSYPSQKWRYCRSCDTDWSAN